VNLWGASPLDENGCLKEGSIPNVTPIDKVLGEGNCGRVTDRGEEAGAQSCEATYRNAIEAERDPEVSCPWTAKPFPTDSKVDGELVQRKFTLLFGEICDAYP
jgi:hypothetical protein